MTANALCNAVRKSSDFTFRWHLYSQKPHRVPIDTADVHAIQKQHVKMNVQVQRTAEALNQGNCTSLCHGLCEARFVG